MPKLWPKMCQTIFNLRIWSNVENIPLRSKIFHPGNSSATLSIRSKNWGVKDLLDPSIRSSPSLVEAAAERKQEMSSLNLDFSLQAWLFVLFILFKSPLSVGPWWQKICSQRCSVRKSRLIVQVRLCILCSRNIDVVSWLFIFFIAGTTPFLPLSFLLS